MAHECPQEPTLPCHHPLDQVKTSKLELYEDTMEEELEEYNMLKEELDRGQWWRRSRMSSTCRRV